MYKVMGTGSRSMVLAPDAKDIYKIIEYKIMCILESHPDLVLITGMAEGFDEAIAKVGMRNKIPYHCYLPNEGYGDYYWRRNSKLGKNRFNVFSQLVSNAAEVNISCTRLYEDGVHANFIRNMHMVEDADLALVYQPSSPGTAHALRLIKSAKMPYEIYPFSDRLFE